MGINDKLKVLTAHVTGQMAEKDILPNETGGAFPDVLGKIRRAGLKGTSMAMLALTLTAGSVAAEAQQAVPVFNQQGQLVGYQQVSPEHYQNKNQPGQYETSLPGMAIGGVAGGVLGNQIGKGNGKLAATGLGAVIGSSIGGGGKPANVGAAVGGLAGGLLGSLVGGGTGQAIATAIGAIAGASIGNDYVHDSRVREAATEAELRKAEAFEREARGQQAKTAGVKEYKGPLAMGPHGMLSACMVQFMQGGEGKPLRSNPQADKALNQALAQLIEKRTQLDEAVAHERNAENAAGWAVSSLEKETLGEKARKAAQERFEAERHYAVIGMHSFFQVCDRAAIQGYDVSEYAKALNHMDYEMKPVHQLKSGTVMDVSVARTYAPKNKAM